MAYLIIIISSVFYIFIKTKKNTQILQQNFYNENNRYLRWGNKNLKKVFNIYELMLCFLNFINIFIFLLEKSLIYSYNNKVCSCSLVG